MKHLYNNIEYHPLEPFLPQGATLLMLGSFPPGKERWSMNFFYPNHQNDMWRIMGLIFYGNKNHLLVPEQNKFDYQRIIDFCIDKKLALYDTACVVRRLKDNASDKFLEVITQTNIKALLEKTPECITIVATGQKAAEIIAEQFCSNIPAIGDYTTIQYETREIKFWRMPSTSRAYPLALDKKAAFYSKIFPTEAILSK